MNKLIICIAVGVLLILGILDNAWSAAANPHRLAATDTVRQLPVVDTVSESPDTTAKKPVMDTIAVVSVTDTAARASAADTVRQDPSRSKDTVRTLKDSTAKEASDWVKDT